MIKPRVTQLPGIPRYVVERWQAYCPVCDRMLSYRSGWRWCMRMAGAHKCPGKQDGKANG